MTFLSEIFCVSCFESRPINSFISEIEAANNSGSIFVIVFKFFINPNFEASAIAIFKTPSDISNGTSKLSWMYLISIIFFIFGSITFFDKSIEGRE